MHLKIFLANFFHTQIEEYRNSSKEIKFSKLTNLISMTFGLLAAPYVILLIIAGFYLPAALLVGFLASMFLIKYINSRGFYNTTKFLVVLLASSTISIISMLLGAESYTHWCLFIIIATAFLLFSFSDKNSIFSLIVCLTFLTLVFILFEYYKPSAVFQLSPLAYTFVRYNNIFTAIFGITIQLVYLRFIVDENERILRQVIAENLAFRAALDQTAIVACTDKSGTITQINNNFCNISGYQKDELVGQNHRILNSGHHSRQYFENLWKTISSGKPWRGEICNKTKDGRLYWVDTAIVPSFAESGKIDKYYSVRFDITDKKYSEEQWILVSKMAALGEMASGVAHEINTPLAIIQLRTDQMLGAVNSGQTFDIAKMQKSLNDINKTVHRITKIISGLRFFSRNTQDDELVDYSLKSIIQDTLELYTEKLRLRGVSLELHIEDDYSIKCNPTEISQVLLNLLNNSMDAIEDSDKQWIKIELKRGNNVIELAVTDNGAGISKNIQDKIMQPFFTTKEVGKGTGLGLSISRGIVESHGGKLRVDNDSHNTRFIIQFPMISINQLNI